MKVNKVYCGNCIDLIDELDISPKLIILSPPDLEKNFTIEEYKQFIKKIYSKSFNKINDGVLVSCTTDRKINGRIYLKHVDIINSIGEEYLFNYKIWAKSLKTNLYILNYTHMLFFRKNKKIINNKLKEFYPDVWLIENDKIKGYKSKDSFPIELVKRLILNFTNEGDLVLDPFIGSGKTGKVAKKLNRNFIGFEINKKYVDIAEEVIKK